MLTSIQRIELILIPIVTILSVVLVSIYGALMIGEISIQLISVPLTIGMICGLFVAFIIDKKYTVTSFELANQNMRRGLFFIVIIAFAILLGQLMSILDVFLTLALMGGSLGMGISIMDFFCLILLYRVYRYPENEKSTNNTD